MENWKELLQLIATKIVDYIRSPEIVVFNSTLWDTVKDICYDIIIALREIIDCFVN